MNLSGLVLLGSLLVSQATPAEIRELIENGELVEARARLDGSSLPAITEASLEGLLALAQGDFPRAERRFRAAREIDPEQPSLRLYLAHVLVAQEEYAEARSLLEGTEDMAESQVAQPLVLAKALRGLGEEAAAFGILTAAVKRFPQSAGPPMELVALAVDQSLYTEARRWGELVLGREPDKQTVLGLIHAVYPDRRSAPLIEAAAARFPHDPAVLAHLAHAYAGWERWNTAAALFTRATRLGGNYAFEAADQYRLAGNYTAALRLNGQVPEERKRLRQRLTIAFSAGEMGRVVALQRGLERLDLMETSVRYRLAYAHYVLGQEAQAMTLARTLDGTSYHGAARDLLRAMGRSMESN